MILAGAVAVVTLVGIVLLAVHVVRGKGDSESAPFRFGATQPAAAPFDSFSRSRVTVDHRCLHVLVASTGAQRLQGLREVTDLGAYDGMLFVFPSDALARFTMAQTPLPLDIGWYTADGAPVDRARMTPCPRGSDTNCPSYGPRRKYRYALETRAGALGGGALSACGS
jgi:uncharacterized membrane protein (UPF0127 family)